jgi:hypothetical protein
MLSPLFFLVFQAALWLPSYIRSNTTAHRNFPYFATVITSNDLHKLQKPAGHSVVCLATGPFASSKASSPESYLKLQYIIFCLILSSSRLRLLPRLPSSSIYLPIPCFKTKFLSKIRLIQLAFLGFIVSKTFLLWLQVMLLHFWQDRPNWSSPSFSNTIFQNS